MYQCAIGIAGVYDLELMHERGDIKNSTYGRNYLDTVIDKDWAKARSPVAHAAQIKVPVLLVHGGKDDRVPPVHAKRMKAALEEAGNTPEWLLEAREGHGFADLETRIKMYQQVLAFLDKHIGS